MDTREYVIQTYEKVLAGQQKGFSPYFFQPQHRKEKIQHLIRYLIEEKLKMTPEEALEHLNKKVLQEYQLTCVSKYVPKPIELADDDMSHLVYFAYPHLSQPTEEERTIRVYDEVLSGRRKTFPKNYFLNGEIGEKRAILCFKHLCEDIMKLKKEDIPKLFVGSNGLKLLAQYKLKIILNIIFSSTIELINTAYPGEFDFSQI